MPKYVKHDSEKGYIDDYVEIQALKFNNLRHVVLDGMLGDFDEQGFYMINPDVVKELIAMPKYIVEVMDNLEICLSTLKLDKQITFLIAYEGEKATLSLLEKVNFEANAKLGIGSWSNVNEYVLDSVETSGEIDRQALYLKWNVQTFAGEIVDIFNCEDSVLAKYFNIVNRFKENIEAKTTLLELEEKLEENEAEYFLDLMDILKDYPELNKLVQKGIKQILNDKKDFVKLDKPNFVKTLNEVVEKAIEGNVKVLTQTQQDKFLEEKRNVTLKKNIKNYDIVQLSTNKIENKNERSENLEDNNVIENDGYQTVTRIKTDDVRFKSLKDIADQFATAEREASKKKRAGAIAVITGKDDSTKTDKGETVNSESVTPKLNKHLKGILKIIQGLGVEPHQIVSAPVLDEVADKNKKGTHEQTTETGKGLTANPTKGNTSNKATNNKSAGVKGSQKKAGTGNKKAGTGNKKAGTTTKTKTADKNTGKTTKGGNAQAQTKENQNSGGFISALISGRRASTAAPNDKTTPADLGVSADRLRYTGGQESNIGVSTVDETQTEVKTNPTLNSSTRTVESGQKGSESETKVLLNKKLGVTEVPVTKNKLRSNAFGSSKDLEGDNISL